MSAARIRPALPADLGEGDDTSFLDGARVIRAGTIRRGGDNYFALAFDAGAGEELALFAFSELGMWLVSRNWV